MYFVKGTKIYSRNHFFTCLNLCKVTGSKKTSELGYKLQRKAETSQSSEDLRVELEVFFLGLQGITIMA